MTLVALLVLWFFWLLLWAGLTLWFRPAVSRGDWRLTVPLQCLWLAGIFLLLGFNSGSFDLRHRLWPPQDGAGGWSLIALAAAGLSFSVWARIHLGHPAQGRRAVVDNGPYALVRHPVYLGAGIAALASAALQGIPSAFLGCALMFAGFALKSHAEERHLRRNPAYRDYAMRVPMLLPYPKRLLR